MLWGGKLRVSTIARYGCRSVPNCHKRNHIDSRHYQPYPSMKSSVISDWIERYHNDINMVETEEPCKYMAMIKAILIIVLIVYMFWDDEATCSVNKQIPRP